MRLIKLNLFLATLLGLGVLAIFQGGERDAFNCELFCRDPHILYTISTPLFLITTLSTVYILVREKTVFKATTAATIKQFILNENRAYWWIWTWINILSFILIKIQHEDNLRGPFLLAIAMGAIYTIYNIVSLFMHRFITYKSSRSGVS